MKHSSIGAVIFDLDGTLADTIKDLAAAFNSVLAAHGHPGHSFGMYKKMVGNGFMALMERSLPPLAATDKEHVGILFSEAVTVYTSMALDTTKPFPGVQELLSTLQERSIILAVLSNKPDEMTRQMVSALFPGTSFIAVFGDKASRPRKPDPSAALSTAALSDLPASRWAFVGDSGVDMATGLAGGMLPLGASWGYRSREELRTHGAAAILEKPSDLLLHL